MSNFTVMIVDDERAIRENLPKIPCFEEAGFKVVAKAKNGIEAFEKLVEIQPELILLDVNMPMMSGIEFVKKLRNSEYRDTQVIMLSGYNEFEYARQAMRYGAKGYLTKPFDEDEAYELLREVYKDLEKMKEEAKKSHMQEIKALYDSLHAGRSKEVSALEGYGLLYLLKEESKEPLIWNEFSSSEVIEVRKRSCYASYLVEKKAILHRYSGYEAFLKKNKHIALLDLMEYENNELTFREQLTHNFYQMVTPTFYDGIKHVVYPSTSRVSESCLATKCEFLNQLKQNLTEGLSQKIEHDFLAMSREAKDVHYAMDMVYAISFRIYYIIYETLSQLDCSVEGIIFPEWRDYEVFYSYDMWHNMTLEQLQLACRRVEEEKESGSNDVYQEILDYIHCHYNETLSIQNLSQTFYLNATYLGRMFKKEKGMGIKQYIHQIRIERAKRLLLETDMKVYEIAEQVGYDKSKYFVSKFSDVVGLSPMSFRQDAKGVEHA